ncbi:hypothetical protein ACJRO7_026598 [Eucalyptus globulus]|uniref:Uncharacterized protein n=1 Tax=Eucalyptus globulus TaxID=34317 RepID=A0ABD3JNT7_EUCGL
MLQEIISPFETDRFDVLKSICEHLFEHDDDGVNATFWALTPASIYSRSSSFNSLFLTESWSELSLKINDSEDMLVYGALRDALNFGWTMSSASNQLLDFEVTTIDYNGIGQVTGQKPETVEREVQVVVEKMYYRGVRRWQLGK